MAHKGVQSAVIVNADGIPIRTMPATMEHKEAVMFPGVLMPVIQKARQMIKALDPQNDFSALRMRSAKNEVLVYPEARCSTALHGSKSDAPIRAERAHSSALAHVRPPSHATGWVSFCATTTSPPASARLPFRSSQKDYTLFIVQSAV